MNTQSSSWFPFILLVLLVPALVWSGHEPHDRFTWLLEVAPAVIGLAVLLGTYRRFRLTSLAYALIWLHMLVLLIGGHYTYAEVPAFNWLRETLHLARNHYDRVGHFAQGFVPAILAREILLRASPLRPGKWLVFLITCICLAISAVYELLEWFVALGTGEAAAAFLGTQGDVWDTQSDMAWALTGCLTALLLLSRRHDRQLALLPVARGERLQAADAAEVTAR